MNLKVMTDRELLENTKAAVRSERDATTNVIRHFQEIYDRRLFLPRYTSMFEMLRNEYSYCAGSAQIRLNAMNLIRDVPAVEAKIESGEMSLTVAANVQSFLKAEKKNSRPYSANAKIELVETCVGKSVVEVEQEFARRNPEMEKRESVRFTSEDRVRVSHSLSLKVEEKLQRIKEIWSHVDPNMSREEVLDRMSEIVLNQIDPVRKAKRIEARKAKSAEAVGTLQTRDSFHVDEVETLDKRNGSLSRDEWHGDDETMSSKTVHQPNREHRSGSSAQISLHVDETKKPRSRYIAAQANRSVYLSNSDQGCAFRDAITGKRCGSKFQLQRDHILPYAQGGANELENLRLLCAQHNRWRSRSGIHIKTDYLTYG